MQNIFSLIWNEALYVPILNLLIYFYHILWSNLGLSIIATTLLIKLVTLPLTKPSIELAKKQKELQPEIDKLKQKYKNKQVFAQKQMELYQKHGINPAAGCLPQIITVVVFFAMYSVFRKLLAANGVMIDEVNSLLYNWDFLKFPAEATLNTSFLYMNLAKPDPFYILPVVAAASQFFLSRYMMQTSKGMGKVVEDTPDKKDDVMYNMQQQSMYMFPVMTLIIGVNLPSGLVFYWFISTIVSLAQYMVMSRPKDKENGSNPNSK